jgi:lipid A disaccharide synthetase
MFLKKTTYLDCANLHGIFETCKYSINKAKYYFENGCIDCVDVKYANLINILSDREIIPEFTLYKCRANLIADRAPELMDSNAAKLMIRDMDGGLQKLRLPDMTPSDKAAKIVMEMIFKS